MKVVSAFLPAILAGTVAMLLSVPMVSANMRFLVSIRTRLDRLVNIDELSANQYTYIVNNIASNELLDAEMKDHSIHISVPRLSDEISDYFCDWLDQEEINGDMMEGTANLIRNLFELGAAPSRPEDIPLSRINGPAQATYKNNGIVKFVARINFSPPSGGIYNGIWGFTKGSREYALHCNSIGLNVVDVTTTDLVLIQTIPMPGGTTWRDVATNGNYAYVAAQGGSNPVAWVVNLSELSGSSPQGLNSDPISVNNIKNIGNQGWGHTMNVWNDLLFLNGAGGFTNGCRIFDLLPDPMSPKCITTYTAGDCHDSYGQRIGQRDVLFSADGYTGRYRLLDISNIRTSTQIPKIGETNFVSGAYAHQNVVSDDGKTLFVFDEFNKFDIGVYDISDLSTPELITTLQWSGEQSEGNAIVHNGLILGNYLVVAYYKAGLRVFDISNTSNIQEVGKYETFRDPNGDGIFDENSLSGYDGAWNVAKLPSGKILISDTVSGTFVVTLNDGPGPPTPVPQSNPTPAPQSNPTRVPQTNPAPVPQSNPTRAPQTNPTRAPQTNPTRRPRSDPTPAPYSNPSPPTSRECRVLCCYPLDDTGNGGWANDYMLGVCDKQGCHYEKWDTGSSYCSGENFYQKCVDQRCNSPVTSPVKPPTPTPQQTPVTNPTPVSSPVKSPTDSCKEDSKAKFLFKQKINKKGNLVTKKRTCKWLEGKDEKTTVKFCKKKNKCYDKFGSAADTCPDTCGSCGPCHESETALFFRKDNGTKILTKSCRWLASRSDKEELCQNTTRGGCYAPASEVCPVTCSITGCTNA